VQPRATEHIDQMVALIQELIERGHAYEAEGHVLFHVPSMADYGKLSNRSVEEMQAGARVEVAPYKKDPMDFVLWKPAPEGEQGFASALGRGRPGWHIECSAMAKAHLGEVFDIHGGGIDLVFPHHENEIAQSRCAHGSETMARYWLHNGFLQVEGEKMSKSLGNFITIREVLNDWPGEVARFAMLMTHYRQPINWTVKTLTEAQKTLTNWYEIVGDVDGAAGLAAEHDAVYAALRDDLNTPKAISELHQLKSQPAHLKRAAGLMGLLETTGSEWAVLTKVEVALSDNEIESAIAARLQAKANKDWAEADRIRDDLLDKGIELKDGPEGTSWEVKS
jgi:cysteinyl-tRNA synthetase